MRRGIDLRLCLVTDPALCAARGLEATVAAAVAGGATAVQLRDKEATDAALVALARGLRAALAGTGVALVVNDRPPVARAAGADGAHIGQSDGDPAAARALLGPDLVLGLSIETPAQLGGVDPKVVDYLGVGPIRATATKPGHAAPLGWAGAAAIAAAAPVPTVAIGGLGPGDAAAARRGGMAGVAVVTAICAACDPEAAARALRREWEAAA